MVWFCRMTGERAPSRTLVPWARLMGEDLIVRLRTGETIVGLMMDLLWEDGTASVEIEGDGDFGWQPAVTDILEVEETTPPVRFPDVLAALLQTIKGPHTDHRYPEFYFETSGAIYEIIVERRDYWPWADRERPSTGATPVVAGDWLSVQIY